MSDLQAAKFGLLLKPSLKNDGDFSSNGYLDTEGAAAVTFLFIVGDTDAAIGSTAEGTAPKIEEADNSNFSDASDVSSAALSSAIAADDDGKLFAIRVNLAKTHKKYMRVQAPHAGAGTTGAYVAIIAILEGQKVATGTAAGMGLEEFINA